MLGLKKILRPKKFWVQKNFESMKLWDEKIFGPKQFLVQRKDFGCEKKSLVIKKSLDLKEFWLQGKLLSKNIGEEKLSPGQMLQGQMSL